MSSGLSDTNFSPSGTRRDFFLKMSQVIFIFLAWVGLDLIAKLLFLNVIPLLYRKNVAQKRILFMIIKKYDIPENVVVEVDHERSLGRVLVAGLGVVLLVVGVEPLVLAHVVLTPHKYVR